MAEHFVKSIIPYVKNNKNIEIIFLEPIPLNNHLKGTWAYDLYCRTDFILTNEDKIEFLKDEYNEYIKFKKFDAKQIKTSLKERIL